jgi:hypothetical protein
MCMNRMKFPRSAGDRLLGASTALNSLRGWGGDHTSRSPFSASSSVVTRLDKDANGPRKALLVDSGGDTGHKALCPVSRYVSRPGIHHGDVSNPGILSIVYPSLNR